MMTRALEFPDWVPSCVRDAANRLHDIADRERDPAKAKIILKRLTTDPRMSQVWKELYRRHRQGERSYFNPATIRTATMSKWMHEKVQDLRKPGADQHDVKLAEVYEAEAASLKPRKVVRSRDGMTEQDQGVQEFFVRVYRSALDDKPFLYGELKRKEQKLRAVAKVTRREAAILKRIEARDLSKRFEDIAVMVDFEADCVAPQDATDDPALIIRKTGDIAVRTLIASISIAANIIFHKDLYSTVATVVTVIVGRKKISFSQVREALRSGAK